MEPGTVNPYKCLVLKTGKTLNSDKALIDQLKKHVHLQNVETANECNFILVFCPIVSRAQTDIEAALKTLQNISDTKPAVLVLLHHTFDPDCVVPDSRRAVKRKNTITVDCLFYEDQGLLQCYKNEESLEKITHYMTTQAKEHYEKQKKDEGPGKCQHGGSNLYENKLQRLDDCETQVENKDTELRKRAKSNEKKDTNTKLAKEIKELQGEVEELKKILVKKDNEILGLEAYDKKKKLSCANEKIMDLKKLLKDKDTQLETRDRELEIRKKEIKELMKEKERLLTENAQTLQMKDKTVGEKHIKEQKEQEGEDANTELPEPKGQLELNYNSLKNEDQKEEQNKRQIPNQDTELKSKNLIQEKGALSQTIEKNPSGRDAAVLETSEKHDNATGQLEGKNSHTEKANKLMSEKETQQETMNKHLETSKNITEKVGQELHDQNRQQVEEKESEKKTNSLRRCTNV